MVFLVVRIVCGAKELKKWFGCCVADNATFMDVYSDFAAGVLDRSSPLPEEFNTVASKVYVGKSPNESGVQIQPDLAVADVVHTLGVYVQFHVKKLETDSVDDTIIIDSDDEGPNASTFL